MNHPSVSWRSHTPAPVDLSAESVAGEEDPGASIELALLEQAGEPAPMSPGDEAPPGTPGTGEKTCPRCGGSGKLAGSTCALCGGTGKITAGIGGA